MECDNWTWQLDVTIGRDDWTWQLDVTYIWTPTDRMCYLTWHPHLLVYTTDFHSHRIATFEILFLYSTSSSKFFSKSKVPYCSRLILAYSSKSNFIKIILSSVKKKTQIFFPNFALECWRIGPGSVADIATGYGLDGPGIEFRWERDFLSRPVLKLTQPPAQMVPVLSRG